MSVTANIKYTCEKSLQKKTGRRHLVELLENAFPFYAHGDDEMSQYLLTGLILNLPLVSITGY